MIGPNDAALVVLCSDAHRSVLQRCIDSVVKREGGSLVNEIVVGYQSEEAPILDVAVPKDDRVVRDAEIDVQAIRVGDVTHQGEALNTLARCCTRPWILFLDADDVIEAPGSHALRQAGIDLMDRVPAASIGSLGLSISAAQVQTRSDLNALWLPYDYEADEEDRVIVRRVTRRIVRWKDGWRWRGAADPDLVLAGRDEVGRSKQEAAALRANLLVRRRRIVGRGVVGEGKLARLIAEDPEERRLTRDYWIAYELAQLGRYAEADAALLRIAEAQERMGAGRTDRDRVARLRYRVLIRAKRYADAGAEAAALRKISKDDPDALRYSVAVWHAGEQWGRVVDLYQAWRGSEARLGACVRLEDEVLDRKTLAHLQAGEAYLILGNLPLALKALEEAQEGFAPIRDMRVDYLLRIARARLGGGS